MSNEAPERLGPHKEAMLKCEAAYALLREAEALLAIPRPTELPRLRVAFPDSKDYLKGRVNNARH